MARNPKIERLLEEADLVTEDSISKVLQLKDEAAESVESLLLPKKEIVARGRHRSWYRCGHSGQFGLLLKAEGN